MSIQVYHATDPTFGFGDDPAWPGSYERVAEVDVPDARYERAYELTNTIEKVWWENEGVQPDFDSPAFVEIKGVKGARSTSVGDVLVLSDGRVLRCASFGWDEVAA